MATKKIVKRKPVIKTKTGIKGHLWWVQKYEKRKIRGKHKSVPVVSIDVTKERMGRYSVDTSRNLKIFPTKAKAISSAKRTILRRKR